MSSLKARNQYPYSRKNPKDKDNESVVSDAPSFIDGANSLDPVQIQQTQQTLGQLQRVVRKLYFVHLIVIALIYTFLLFRQKPFPLSFTKILLGIYCYMIFWNWIVNFLLVMTKKQNLAIIFNRVIIRFLIMLYFPLGISAVVVDNYLGSKMVLFLTLYLALVSLLFILYQLYGCTIGEPRNPRYIFHLNHLEDAKEKIWSMRKKYNQEMIRHQKMEKQNK